MMANRARQTGMSVWDWVSGGQMGFWEIFASGNDCELENAARSQMDGGMVGSAGMEWGRLMTSGSRWDGVGVGGTGNEDGV